MVNEPAPDDARRRQQSLIDLFHQCIVRVKTESDTGTGFWVAPGTLLTCAHVLGDGSSDDSVHLKWNGQVYQGLVTELRSRIDCAVITCNANDIEHPCVRFDEDVHIGDNLYTFGFTDQYPEGDSAAPNVEGFSQDPLLLKLKGAQIRPGLSGAPLLNQQTGGICGMVSRTRDRSSSLGGRAVPWSVIERSLPRVADANRQFYAERKAWTQFLPGASESRSPNQDLPRYRDAAALASGKKLRQLRARLSQLESEDTSAIREEILEIRRSLRNGPQLCAGDCLCDRFVLLEQAGRGGFGTVWRALDEETGNNVAVKVLHNRFGEGTVQRQRFARGARHMKELQSANIARVIAAPQEDDGYYFYVLEYYARGSFAHAVREAGIDQSGIRRVVRGVSAALSHAHNAGIVHRDVSPENILLTNQGDAVLSDFDLVYSLDTTGGTQTREAMGRYIYSAEEVLTGSRQVDSRADVFSFGMCLVFAHYGRDLPFSAFRDSKVFIGELDISEKLKNVLTRAVQSDPDQRYASVSEFTAAYLNHSHESSRRANHWPRIFRHTVDVIALAALGAMGLGLLGHTGDSRPDANQDPQGTAASAAGDLQGANRVPRTPGDVREFTPSQALESILSFPDPSDWQKVARERKNIREMTREEIQKYAVALAALYRKTSDGPWKDYALMPDEQPGYSLLEHAHTHAKYTTPHFLPWNRAFLRYAELTLQTIDPDVSIPYWDWTAEGGIPEPFEDDPGPDNPLFGIYNRRERYLGDPSNRRQVPPFEHGSTSFQTANFSKFSSQLENEHNLAHMFVGGDMNYPATSTRDPLFWSLQANVDRLWAQWQELHPEQKPPERSADNPNPMRPFDPFLDVTK